jgi:hypothetical protein
MFVSESKMTGVLRRLIMFVYILMTGWHSEEFILTHNNALWKHITDNKK